MRKLSLSLAERHVRELDARQYTTDVRSRSEAARSIIDEWDALRTECDRLERECEQLRTECDQRERRISYLEEQLAERTRLESKVDDLVARQDDEPDPPWPVRWWRWWRSGADT